jgi:hypothetical protein
MLGFHPTHQFGCLFKATVTELLESEKIVCVGSEKIVWVGHSVATVGQHHVDRPSLRVNFLLVLMPLSGHDYSSLTTTEHNSFIEFINKSS